MWLLRRKHKKTTTKAPVHPYPSESDEKMPANEGVEEKTAKKPLKFHVPASENTSAALFNKINMCDYGWKMNGANWMTEAQTFYLISSQGELVFIQVAYSNLSWPAQTICQVTSRYFDAAAANLFQHQQSLSAMPDSILKTFKDVHKSGRGALKPLSQQEGITNKFGTWTLPAGKMKLDPTKTSFQIKQTAFTQQPTGSYLIKHEESELCKFKLRFHPLTDPFSINDGCIHFGTDRSDGHIHLKFLPFGRFEGTMTMMKNTNRDNSGSNNANNNASSNGNTNNVYIDNDVKNDKNDLTIEKEISGYGFGIHQFQGVKPYLSASQWNFFYFQSDDSAGGDTRVGDQSISSKLSLFMIQITTPAAYDRVKFNIGSVFADGKLIGVSIGNKINSLDHREDRDSKYKIPGEFLYEWAGVTFENEPFSAHCASRPTLLCTKECILDNLPFVIRKVIEAFISRPYVYQWVDRATVELKVGETQRFASGWCFQELALINSDGEEI